MLERTLM